MRPPTSMDARIAQRRAQVRREHMHRRRRRTIGVAVLLALFVVGTLIEQGPLVALAEVQVTGTDRLDPDTVRAAAALRLGTSTLRLRLGAAARRIKALPLVQRATVRRIDPLTVRIHVQERKPVLVLRTARGSALVDGAGVVVAHGSQPGLPVVATSALVAPPAGTSIAAVPAAADAYRIHAGLPGPLRSRVARYEARRRDDVRLMFVNGLQVRFGMAAQVAEKSRVLAALLEDLGDRRVAVIDVRVASNPVVVPREQGVQQRAGR